MASQGPNSPSSVTSGFGTWTDMTNVYASDNAYATAVVGSSTSPILVPGGFGFNIPANATIDGIKVEIEHRASTASALQYAVIQLDSDGGRTSDFSGNAVLPGADTYVAFGGPTNLLGGAWWTPEDINNGDLVVRISVQRAVGSGSYTAYIDHVRITVYYTENSEPTISGASVTYASGRSATGPNTTWGVTFTPADADAGDQGANALDYEIRTGASGGGSLIDSGTCTHNAEKVVTGLAYSAVSSEGSNTVYLRVSDGDEWSDDTSLTVRRDSVAPSASSISTTPGAVAIDKQYTVTFTPSDATSTGGNEIGYAIWTGAGATGVPLAVGNATSGVQKTTPTITDTAPNYISNGTFETNVSGWLKRTGAETLERDATKAAVGSASMKITPAAVSDGAYAIAGGEPSTAYMHRHRVWVPAGCTVRLYAWDDVAGFELLDTAIGNDDWQTLEGEVTTGAGSTAYRTYSIIESATLAPWWIDDVSVWPTSEPGLQHGSNTRYLRLTDAAGNVYETSFAVTADYTVTVSVVLQTRVEAELKVPVILQTMVGVVPVTVPVILQTQVEPSIARIERHLSGNAGAMGHRLRFEARTKTNQYIRDITDGILTSGASIECNSDRAIKRTASFRCDPDQLDFDPRREFLSVHYSHLIDGRYWMEWPLGLYRVDEPQRTIRPTGEEWQIQCYDLARLLIDDMPGDAYVIPSGTNRMTHAATVLDNLGLLHALPTSSITASKDVSFEPGRTWLDIVNDDAQAAGMYTIWPRASDARFTTRIPGDIASRTPDAAYDLLGFILAEPIKLATDLNRFANRVVVTSTSAGLSAVAVNDDPSSEVSTVALGWTKSKTFVADAVDNQTVLDDRAARELREATSAYMRLGLTTHLDPRREPFELITVDGGDRFGANDWYVRNWRMDLSEGGQRMTWELSRVESYR